MKTTIKTLLACGILLALTLTPTTASATPQLTESQQIDQYAQSYTAPETADIALPARGSYSVAIVPRVSYPVRSIAISSGFGPRTCKAGPCTRFHHGVDYPGAHGAPVKSIAAGTVRFAGMDGNYGNKVVIDHTIDGIRHTSVYAHLASGSLTVRPGQVIERGVVIGAVGNTGRSYGPHLHFEVHVNAHPVNPAAWFSSHGTLPFP